MPLPAEFNAFEHLQETSSKVLRQLVREEFKDVGDADWEPDITVPRGSLRIACTPDDDDTGAMLLQRFFLLYFVVRAGEDFAPQPYGLLDFGEDISVTKYPLIQIFYKESRYDATNKNRIPIQRRVSFRWRQTDWGTANINQLALEIKNELATPLLKWRCGRTLYTYKDGSKPYSFQINADSELDAKEVIEASMRIQDESEPNWAKFLRKHTRESPPPLNETEFIDGETIKLPDMLPVATVEFAWAQLKFPRVRKPYVLVDATGRKRGARYYV